MPNIWTHILFCEQVVDTMEEPITFLTHKEYIKLGAQGPDPFFYYNFWPWIKDEPVHEVGMALHTRNCGPFLMDLIKDAKYGSEVLRAYVFGFVTHHILDRNTHPYIHYRAGYEGSKHQLLEIQIDTMMMEKLRNQKSWKKQVHREIDVGKTLKTEISDLLHTAIEKHYPELADQQPKFIETAYKDMRLALKLLSDPFSWKNKLFSSLISSYSHQPISNNTDYLNLRNTNWCHPATKEPSNDSFLTLYNKGLKEAVDISTEVLHFWHQETRKAIELERKIANISYDTGLPLELKLENKYSDPIV
ncbi:zinc dependent phospholipase C family protein [Oceanobacillus manasiensis]|uniref:zinc dependent phospholipase C family protein n=1 Tax=Oceanobacillus manasiensis TaxID=586413 RepID=UPI0005AA81CF|nr:zinc dependent phospholipase C family protein [Oceanobacillus manasiensis]